MAAFTFSVLDWKYPFWANLAQICQFKLKLGIKTNLNMQNSMVVFTFAVLDQKKPFLGKFGPKIQSYQFKLKPRT